MTKVAAQKASLGSSWISVHQRGDAVAIAESVLELGFSGIQPGPAPKDLPLDQLLELRRSHPFELGPCLRAAPLMAVEKRLDAGLANSQANVRAEAIDAVSAVVQRASALRIDQILIEPGRARTTLELPSYDVLDPTSDDEDPTLEGRIGSAREAALEQVCRSLHTLSRQHPETTFCLTASRARDGLGRIEILQAIFEDLPRCRLAYWHEAALVAGLEERHGVPQSAWFDALGRYLVGATISDWADGRVHLPVGSGRVDVPGVFDALGRGQSGRSAVVELDPEFGPDEARHAAAIVQSYRGPS